MTPEQQARLEGVIVQSEATARDAERCKCTIVAKVHKETASALRAALAEIDRLRNNSDADVIDALNVALEDAQTRADAWKRAAIRTYREAWEAADDADAEAILRRIHEIP